MNPLDRREYLERLIMGLEQAVENTRSEINYYTPGDLQLKYAKKFLAAAEENLTRSRKELEELLKSETKPNPPE